MSIRFRRTLSVLVGIAAVSAAACRGSRPNSGRKEEQAFVNASRGALDIFVKLAASARRARSSRATPCAAPIVVQAEGTGGVLAHGPRCAPTFVEALKQARRRRREAGRRLVRDREARWPRVPEDFAGLDQATLEALEISSPAQLVDLVEQQNA